MNSLKWSLRVLSVTFLDYSVYTVLWGLTLLLEGSIQMGSGKGSSLLPRFRGPCSFRVLTSCGWTLRSLAGLVLLVCERRDWIRWLLGPRGSQRSLAFGTPHRPSRVAGFASIFPACTQWEPALLTPASAIRPGDPGDGAGHT